MTRIRIHNPCNEHTRYYRYYNLFWDKFTEHLRKYFIVEENRYFSDAHAVRFPIKLNGGLRDPLLLLECEYVIENLENNEFVIMSAADDLTHAILDEKENKLLNKVLVSQFLPKKILSHTGENFYKKYSPWTYFQSQVIDLEQYYYKRLYNKPTEDRIYFKGTSLEDRAIIHHIDKNIITNFSPTPPHVYFEEIIKHKLALSVDGRGEFCYRDIECFAIGIPIIRYEFESIFNDKLIPNYHYISIERPESMDKYRLGDLNDAKKIEKKYYEVINDTDFLSFISKNAREYYMNNCVIDNNINKTFDLLGLNSWL